jgi:hypothetical protein
MKPRQNPNACSYSVIKINIHMSKQHEEDTKMMEEAKGY